MVDRFTQITVVSGKGGTGKTTVLASFVSLAERPVMADCDVDAANLHLLLAPNILDKQDFFGAKVAVRDPQKCQGAGECQARCRFDAITVDKIDEFACEGCGMCVLACPNEALRLQPIKNGEAYISETRYGPFAHAKLMAGGESSGRLVTLVRQQAENLALQHDRELILIDGPPGIGCTAVAALADTDLALIVTEPTLSGMHDMERVLGVIKHFGLPAAALINKVDLNRENAEKIRELCRAKDVPIVAELPFDEVVTRAIAANTPLVEFDDGPVTAGIRAAWEATAALVVN